jgi:fumarate reductase flavoprotein subunit
MACWSGGQMVPDFGASAGAEDALGATAALHVNLLGKRFNNEEVPVFQRGMLVGQQPGANYWAIYDGNWREVLAYQTIGHRNMDDNPYPPVDPGEPRGTELLDQIAAGIEEIVGDPEGADMSAVMRARKTVAANTLDELADFMGFDAEAKADFLATVERYNELCRGGKDLDFAKDPAKMLEIKTPPFIASMGFGSMYAPLSGIQTDGDSRVVNAETGKAIEGLWAIGAIQGGRWANGARATVCTGQHPSVMTAGYLAGKMIAEM